MLISDPMKRYLLVLALVSVVLVSGCTIPGNFFGNDVVSVQTKTIENGARDVIVVKDIGTIPTSPMLPDQEVLLSFIVANVDNQRSADLYVDLFNAPLMKSRTGMSCNEYAPVSTARNCVPVDNCAIGVGCSVLAGEEKPVTFNLRTPSETDIKSIKTDVKLNFKTVYSFKGSLNFMLPVVNMEEIVKRQRAGEKTDLTMTKSYSSGPVMIDAEIQGAPYIISNLGSISQNPESTIFFKIRNRGSGNIVNSQIENSMMTITFPQEFYVVPEAAASTAGISLSSGYFANDKFSCTSTTQGTVCRNDRIVQKATGKDDLGLIPLYKDESRSNIGFKVRMKDPLLEPFRTFTITADVNYEYEIRSSVDITINPFYNV